MIVFTVLLLSSCGTENPLQNVPLEETGKVYGFWNGLWDGITAIFAFIGNLFGGHWSIYQVHNNGGWYNFGFLLGIGVFAGGGSSTTIIKSRR
jgi:hypothetical protein